MWEIEFLDACTHHVRNMNWRVAAGMCATILHFAKTGRGRVEHTAKNRIRLRSQGALADIRVDEHKRTLIVLRIVDIS